MTDADLEKLELKIAYLERANQDLSDVLYRQQREIALLQERMTVLASRVDAMKTAETPYTLEEERPPHY